MLTAAGVEVTQPLALQTSSQLGVGTVEGDAVGIAVMRSTTAGEYRVVVIGTAIEFVGVNGVV